MPRNKLSIDALQLHPQLRSKSISRQLYKKILLNMDMSDVSFHFSALEVFCTCVTTSKKFLEIFFDFALVGV